MEFKLIPIFQTNIHTEGLNGNCMRASLASIFEISIDDIPSFEQMRKNKWKGAFKDWLKTIGYSLKETRLQPDTSDFYIVLGNTNRGILHCVVGKNGTTVHDPHPSQTGLTSILKYWSFTQII